jgi:hypothetical protein
MGPSGNFDQALGQRQTTACVTCCQVIAEILGTFLHAAAGETNQRLEEKQTFKHTARHEPSGIMASHVRQFVRQQAFLLFSTELGDELQRETDLSGVQGHRTRNMG